MNLLDPTIIVNLCDYSFGDQSGQQCGICYIKNANIENVEFLSKVDEIVRSGREYMTLFIDNIRLYNRSGIKYTASELSNHSSRVFKDKVVSELFEKNDLLKLCGLIPSMKFIIFTGFEDTPIDDEIFDKIPENVLKIYASNSISFGGKVFPIPYGIKRKMVQWDNSHDTMRSLINISVIPNKLLYINHSITNSDRIGIADLFSNKDWATVVSENLKYSDFLNNIKNHKFMICPDGNAIGCDCHRDWEVIYMRRVPIVKDSEYLRKIFKGFPVLFVNEFADVTDDLLLKNDFLYIEALNNDFDKMDMELVFNECISKSIKNN
jgi:hypothetical protein